MKLRKTGFTLLEFMVAASILAVFAGLLLNRLHYYQEVAEKANMEATARALQSGLHFEMARALMAGQEIDYQRLAIENPMNWLERKPPLYRGEFRLDTGAQARGAWYFDMDNRELVYLPALDGHFVPDSQGHKQVRFRLVLSYGEIQGGEGLGDSPRQALGIKLATVEPYRWFAP